MRSIRNVLTALAAILALTLPMPAFADHHLFVFDQIYSNADGSIQFVVMTQQPTANDEHKWGGTDLTVVSVNGRTVKTYRFDHDLPSSKTADKQVLIGTQSFAALGLVTPDFVFPDGFLPLDKTVLGFADFTFSYEKLPTDGSMALDGYTLGTVPNRATNFRGASASVVAAAPPPPPTATKVIVVEYYNASLDHYFITHVAAEIAALDSGTAIKGWVRTGESFNVYLQPQTGSSPVCRYYMPPQFGNSHFFGRGTAECDSTGQKNPGFVLEDSNFMQVFLPVVGACAPGLVPVYRVFTNRPDANHRYLTSIALRATMVAKGWVAEGDGPDLVVMCAVP